jgi:hypothetical protein
LFTISGDSSEINIGLIVGVVVSITVISIVLVYFIYKWFKLCLWPTYISNQCKKGYNAAFEDSLQKSSRTSES